MKDLLDAPVGEQISNGDINRFFFEPEIKTDKDLAEYYRAQIEKSTSPKDVLFFIKGLASILKMQLDTDYILQQIKIRLYFFHDTAGYTQEDIARHCGVSQTVINKILNNREISLNSILLTGYYLVPDFKHKLLNT